jgi:hypothetical protein
MAAATYDITIEQGATFRFPKFQFGTLKVDDAGAPILDLDGNMQIDEGRDFSGCQFRVQMRKGQKLTSEVVFTVTSEDTNGGINADSQGNVHITVPDEQTDLVETDGYWDLKCYNLDGTEDRLVQGEVKVNLAVTADATTPVTRVVTRTLAERPLPTLAERRSGKR